MGAASNEKFTAQDPVTVTALTPEQIVRYVCKSAAKDQRWASNKFLALAETCKDAARQAKRTEQEWENAEEDWVEALGLPEMCGVCGAKAVRVSALGHHTICDACGDHRQPHLRVKTEEEGHCDCAVPTLSKSGLCIECDKEA